MAKTRRRLKGGEGLNIGEIPVKARPCNGCDKQHTMKLPVAEYNTIQHQNPKITIVAAARHGTRSSSPVRVLSPVPLNISQEASKINSVIVPPPNRKSLLRQPGSRSLPQNGGKKTRRQHKQRKQYK